MGGDPKEILVRCKLDNARKNEGNENGPSNGNEAASSHGKPRAGMHDHTNVKFLILANFQPKPIGLANALRQTAPPWRSPRRGQYEVSKAGWRYGSRYMIVDPWE